MNLIAIDSAAAICSVAVLSHRTPQPTFHTASYEGSTQHAEHILSLVEQSLNQADVSKQDLNVVVFAQGPGGFTGLRVAVGVSQGLAYALGLDVIPVSSLLAVAAQQTPSTTPTIEVVISDARMQELYVGAYERTAQGWYALHKPFLVDQHAFLLYLKQLQAQQQQLAPQTSLRVSGDGLEAFVDVSAHIQALGIHLGSTEKPSIHSIAQLGAMYYQQQRTLSPDQAAPLYVRNKVAYTIQERADGLGGNPSARWVLGRIQPMQQAQSTALAALDAQLQTHPWSAAQFESSLQAGDWGWVINAEQQPVAYVLLRSLGTEAELLLIGVAPSHQRQGLAQQLLCYAEQYAKAQGCTCIHLEVRASNYAALELYGGADYTRVGLRKNYYAATSTEAAEDALLYTKYLA